MLLNSFAICVKAKFQIGQFKLKCLKQIFYKFEGQCDQEDQAQGHQFSKSNEAFRQSINSSSLKIKF